MRQVKALFNSFTAGTGRIHQENILYQPVIILRKKPLAFRSVLPNTSSMSTQETLVVLADIHGNTLALEAVLADAGNRDLTRFVNLGDTFYGPLDPAGTWDIIRGMKITTVLGNQDRILIEGGPDLEKVPAFQVARNGIGIDGLAWLATLPATIVLTEDILLCHGTPKSDTTYLLEDISTGLPGLKPCDDIMADLTAAARGCTLVLTGHSHHAGLVNCRDITIVNPGSVGLPACDDDNPPHVMASGSPHARYAILTFEIGRAHV